jgi:hypothetical protein
LAPASASVSEEAIRDSERTDQEAGERCRGGLSGRTYVRTPLGRLNNYCRSPSIPT